MRVKLERMTAEERATPEGRSYLSMLNRTRRSWNPNKSVAKEYEGVAVCARWEDRVEGYRNFIKDMGAMPTGERYTIERLDNAGDYEPNNCVWATYAQQANNTSRSIYLSYNGKTMSIINWARELSVPEARLYWRVKQGWSTEDVLSTPSLK